MSRRYFQLSIVWGSLLAVAGTLAPTRGDEKSFVQPRIVRVTHPEAERAVEVSVAINPTKPDHLIAVSICAWLSIPASAISLMFRPMRERRGT